MLLLGLCLQTKLLEISEIIRFPPIRKQDFVFSSEDVGIICASSQLIAVEAMS